MGKADRLTYNSIHTHIDDICEAENRHAVTRPTIKLSFAELANLVTAALMSLGLNSKERKIVGDVLIWAELRGNSQGLGKIVARAVAPNPAAGEIVVTHRSPMVTQIEGNMNLGMVVMGLEGTVQVTMEHMIHHTRAVVRGCKRPLVIGDMPFRRAISI